MKTARLHAHLDNCPNCRDWLCEEAIDLASRCVEESTIDDGSVPIDMMECLFDGWHGRFESEVSPDEP